MCFAISRAPIYFRTVGKHDLVDPAEELCSAGRLDPMASPTSVSDRSLLDILHVTCTMYLGLGLSVPGHESLWTYGRYCGRVTDSYRVTGASVVCTDQTPVPGKADPPLLKTTIPLSRAI